ncbi:MAG: lysophospholipid acyltransferase family protein [Proteobacteria bacterium]|nr:lysophospholipid acyltransferase family protein [Pseudomonadota bacterium]HOL38045.1 lysophospholipid acyltransferase family protein [Rubrivivax sp.]
MFLVLRWLARRSLRFLHALGALLGWIVWAAAPSYRRRLAANAAAAGIGGAERRAAVAEAGRMVLEMPRLWLRPAGDPLADAVQWEGAELVERALDAGRGLVLLTPHMGSFELCAQAYAERFGRRQPVTVLYRPARNAWLRRLEETARARPYLATAPATLGGVRQMLRALKHGQTVGLLPDQVPPVGMGVWAPFFGRDAYTMTLAARLVRHSGAALCAIWGERLPRGAGYHVHVLPMPVALPDARELPGDEGEAQRLDATAINRSMEALIARRPSQYLWGYHRYKTPRPPEVA